MTFSNAIRQQSPVSATSSAHPAERPPAQLEITPQSVDRIVASRPPSPSLRTAAAALLGSVGNAAKGQAANTALPQRCRIKAVEPDAAHGKTTNAMIVDTTTGRVKDGKPVGNWVVRSDAPHRGTPTHHLNMRKDVVGGKDPHTPIAPVVYKAAGAAAFVVEAAERVALPVGLAVDAVRLGGAFAADGSRIGGSTIAAGAGVAAGWAGAAAGSAAGTEGGAMLGGAVGALFGGIGAVPGSAIGAVAGGVAGGIAGAFGASIAGEHIAAAWRR